MPWGNSGYLRFSRSCQFDCSAGRFLVPIAQNGPFLGPIILCFGLKCIIYDTFETKTEHFIVSYCVVGFGARAVSRKMPLDILHQVKIKTIKIYLTVLPGQRWLFELSAFRVPNFRARSWSAVSFMSPSKSPSETMIFTPYGLHIWKVECNLCIHNIILLALLVLLKLWSYYSFCLYCLCCSLGSFTNDTLQK